MDRRGKFTPASLRSHFRWQVSHMDGMDRSRYAYSVLSEAIEMRFTGTQLRAIRQGLALGMDEGIR
jgi:hypothetical protein